MLERYQDLKTENARIEKVQSHYQRFSFDSLPFIPFLFLSPSSSIPFSFLFLTPLVPHTHTLYVGS